MLKFLLNALKFLLLASFAYLVLVIIWVEVDYDSFIKKNAWYELTEHGIDSLGNVNTSGHMFTRMEEIEQIHDVDLLFIGSSQAYRGFDTRIFKEAGFTSFNLGSSNQTPLQSEVLLKQYVQQLNPSKVIYAVYGEVFSVDGVEPSLDLLATNKIDVNLIALVLKQRNLKLFNTMFYATYRNIFKRNKHLKEPIQKYNDTYISGGYVEKKLSHYQPKQYNANQWKINPGQLNALEQSIAFLKRLNIPYVLIQAPTPKVFYNSFTTNQSFDSLMGSYGNYYNFNQLIDLNDSKHFYDPFHMNQLGVEIFNEAVIELLRKNQL